MKPLPELLSFVEGGPEPHILFDTRYRILGRECGLAAPVQPGSQRGRAYLL